MPGAVRVERVTVDRAEPLVERDQRVEVGGDRPADTHPFSSRSQLAPEIAFATVP